MPRRLWGTTNPSRPWLTAVVVVAMIVGFVAAMYFTFRAIADDHATGPSPVKHHHAVTR